MFRRGGPQNGYLAFLGYAETIDLALFDLAKLNMNNGQCLGDVGVEEGPEPGRTIIDGMALAAVRHNLNTDDRTGAVSRTARISVQGSSIRVWYGLTDSFPDDPLRDPAPGDVSAMIEVNDSTYTSGSVGVWHESNDNGVIDNVYVFDASALTVVASKNKLATTWGELKR